MRGDQLSQLLHQGDLGPAALLVGLAVAFALGAAHALSPGHGKTLVAAYLVGTRGTARHAIFLGGVVTFTHTVSVFLLGFVTLFLSHYILPDRLFPILGVISGVSIVWIGAALLATRWRALHHPPHDHHHHHLHGHSHGHGHHHHHLPEGEVTLSSLTALGVSGGLVPCPSALVLLLSSVSLGRVALGLTLLVAFSLGLAVVLTAIGLLVVFAGHLLPRRSVTESRAFRWLPVASAVVIVCVGLAMTVTSIAR